MAGGIWEAIGAALQAGGQTYGMLNAQQQQQRREDERFRLTQQQEERQAAAQAEQLKLQQAQEARLAEAAKAAEEERKRNILMNAIANSTPDTDLTSIAPRIQTDAPELLPLLKRTPGMPQMSGVQEGLGPASAGNPLGLSTAPAFTPGQDTFTRKATLGEQAEQQRIDSGKAAQTKLEQDTATGQRIMDALAAGKLKDTPANRALLAQYTKANPNEVFGAIRQGGAGGGMAGMSELAQTVLANPPLFNQLTPTAKAKISVELAKHGFDFNKPMGEAGMTKIAEGKTAIDQAKGLQTELAEDAGKNSGAIKGFAGLLPDLDIADKMFGTRGVKIMQAHIDAVKQKIGKLMEGGVLRKEDEVKYARILPTVYDSPQVQAYKMQKTVETLQQDIYNYAKQQELAGHKVGPVDTPTSAQIGAAATQTPASKPGLGRDLGKDF